jgi:hypothetical protein
MRCLRVSYLGTICKDVVLCECGIRFMLNQDHWLRMSGNKVGLFTRVRSGIRKFPESYCCNCLGEWKWEQNQRSHFRKHQSVTWHRAVKMRCFYTSAFSTSCFVLSAMDGKIKFCVKLIKSTTETLEMFCEAFGEHFFRSDSGFWMVFTFQGQSSVSLRWRRFRATKHQQNDRKCWKISRNHPWRRSSNATVSLLVEWLAS